MKTSNNSIIQSDKKKMKKISILVFIIIYFSNDTLLFGTNANRNYFYIHIMVLIGVFLWLLFDKNFKSKEKKEGNYIQRNIFFVLLLFIAMTSLTMFLNFDISIKYGYQLFMFLFSILIITRIKIGDFIKGYNRVLFVLSIASIAALTVFKIFPSIIQRLPTLINSTGITYRFYGLGFIEELGLYTITRNYSIFREPGVFSIFLLLAIIFELFFIETNSIKRILTYIVAMILTMSTMSYISLPLILAVYFLEKAGKKNNSIKHPSALKIFSILLIGISILGFTNNLDRMFKIVFNKLYVENASFDSRTSSIFANFDMMTNNPVCGNGFSFVENNFKIYAAKYSNYDSHNTNTLLKILAVYGIPYFLLLIYLLYSFFRKNINFFVALSLLVILCIILSNEDLIVNIILYILAFYGLKNSKRVESS